MKRNLWQYVVVLALLTGLGSCNNKDEIDPGIPNLEESTFMNLSIMIPSSQKSRSADDPNYNNIGEYTGHTGLQHMDIYLLTPDGQTLLSARRFKVGTELVFGNNNKGEDIIRLAKPFKTTPGDKMMHVVINSPNTLSTAPRRDDFLYSSSTSNSLTSTTLDSPQPPPTTPSTAPFSLGYVNMNSYLDTSQGRIYQDVILLTGKTGTFNIQDDKTEQDVINTGVNTIDINVIRIVSRAIITTSASTTVTNSAGTTLGTISNLNYSVVQGANSVYMFPQLDANNYTKSWGYDYVPGPMDGMDYASNAPKYYDYSDINTLDRAVPEKPASQNVSTLPGVFLFENTHPYGTDASNTGYRKGNTPYILVRAKFTPDPALVVNGPLDADGTFYIGAVDGKIYKSAEDARAYENGAYNQAVKKYEAGKTLYYVWLNPDNIQNPVNSPVVRNSIYHVNISSFKSIGNNWNPLVPPGDGSPHNPDPEPPTGYEPESPVDPTGPLSDVDTYMSVEVTVLNWQVHSYNVDL